MSEHAPVEFDLTLEEIPVTLKKSGEPWECVLREMDGHTRDMYLNSQRNKMGDKALKNFEDVQTSLIAKCLYDKSTNELVPFAEIREFPSKVQMKLNTMCIQLCGLGDEQKTEDEAKNS